MRHSFYHRLLQQRGISGVIHKNPLEILFADDVNGCRLDAFDAEQAWLPRTETLDRRYGLAFEKELKGNIFPFVVKPKPKHIIVIKKPLLYIITNYSLFKIITRRKMVIA